MNLPKWNPGFCPARPVREIRATLEGQTLILSLDDETRMVPLQVVDPRGNDWWNERPESWTGAVLDGSLSGMTLRALYPNAAHLIWKSEMETVGVFGVSPALPAAVSFLYNNRGLQHHRREEFPRAGMWFDRALDADPTNDTARFNLACSHARRSDVERTILALRGMPTTGLAKRVANDADFVGIRKDPALKAFLKDL